MDEATFHEYCRSFNDGDKSKTFDMYYTPDAVFMHPLKGTFTGKAAIVHFWTAGHKGIKEILKPVNLVVENDRIAAEFIIEWHCTEDTEYLGPRKKGETYYAECAAFYRLQKDRFANVKLYLKETPDKDGESMANQNAKAV
ncbi:MAG: nuclear transport factor 2 family protein [Myxococcota bacterium]|jgi:ketosteroid isomerase-like protein